MAVSRGTKVALGIGGAAALGVGAALVAEHYLGRIPTGTVPSGGGGGTGGSTGTSANLVLTNVNLAVHFVGSLRRAGARLYGMSRMASYAGGTISGVAPVSPGVRQHVILNGTLKNEGGLSAGYSVIAYMTLAGAGQGGAQQSHLGIWTPPPSGTGGDGSVAPYTGNLGPGQSIGLQLESGPIHAYNEPGDGVANYNPNAGMDIWIAVTNTTSNTTDYYLIPNAVFLPVLPPGQLTFGGISLSVSS